MSLLRSFDTIHPDLLLPNPGFNRDDIPRSPAIGPDGTIYLGANNSNFYAISAEGELK